MELFKFFIVTLLEPLAPFCIDLFPFWSQQLNIHSSKASFNRGLQFCGLEPNMVDTTPVVEFQCWKEVPGGSSSYMCPFFSRRTTSSRQGDLGTHGRVFEGKPFGIIANADGCKLLVCLSVGHSFINGEQFFSTLCDGGGVVYRCRIYKRYFSPHEEWKSNKRVRRINSKPMPNQSWSISCKGVADIQ